MRLFKITFEFRQQYRINVWCLRSNKGPYRFIQTHENYSLSENLTDQKHAQGDFTVSKANTVNCRKYIMCNAQRKQQTKTEAFKHGMNVFNVIDRGLVCTQLTDRLCTVNSYAMQRAIETVSS